MRFMKIRVLFLSLIATLLATQALAGECVRVYYDKGPENYWIGRTYALFTQNLLGHFPEFQQIVSPIEYYKKGDIEKCKATIYISSYYDNHIPEDFFTDYINTTKNVAWMGYNIWKKPELAKVFGYHYSSLTKLDREILDGTGRPTFFKWIDYKGERFTRFGDWSAENPQNFLAAFEMVELIADNSIENKTQILATATHNGTQKTIPYALRHNNHFYVSDFVYSFMSESDRYLIFSDLLFDILDVPPRHQKKMALIRMEDVHPLMPLENLYLFSNTLVSLNVPIHIAIIPFFYDPYNLMGRDFNQEFVAASQHKPFLTWLEDVKHHNARFIWHGVTHQYERLQNPHNGASGADFEFWDAIVNKPVSKDSSSWVLNRLYDGYYELNKIGVQPMIWLTPHYQASTLDNLIFSRVMPWTIGRITYYNFDMTSKMPAYNSDYHFTDTDNAKQNKRLEDLKNITYNITSPWWNGQFFPYEIYGDVHGQRVIPENLGNSQPFKNAHVIRPRSVQQMVADAKRNLVLRDVWASYFYHPFLFNSYDQGGRGAFVGDPSELIYLITEIKKMGYEFIDAEDFAQKNLNTLRPEPIYIVEPKND